MKTPNILAVTLAIVLPGFLAPVQARIVCTNHHDTITWNGLCVLNNQWGRQKALNPDWYQRTVLEDNGTVSIEYKWNGGRYNVLGYPAVIVGWHYGSLQGYRTPMGAWNLPSRVSDNPSYRVSADVSHTNEGTDTEIMNVAWDVWLGTNDNPQVPSCEIMIWPWYVRQIPDGTLQGRISLWGAEWDVYRYQAGTGGPAWNSFAFLRTTPTLQPAGDLGEFIGYLESREWLPGDARILGIQFGPELVRGQGSFRIKSYSLEVTTKSAIPTCHTSE